MKKYLLMLSISCLFITGCDSLRFAPGEAQKQNAWVHNQTAQLAASTARSENVSQNLQKLTVLSAAQSKAFVSYYGMPKEFPPAETVEEVLSQSNQQLAQTALQESAQRPDLWELADSAFELGIGIAALLGGVYGAKLTSFLRQARAKSKALQEIIAGNEIFKKQHAESAMVFKEAHKDQSTETRQLVAQMKVQ